MTCPRCKSQNVSIQAVTETKEKPRHGLLYWLLIGWWLELLLWIFLTVPRLLIALFGPGKKVVFVTHTEAICQNCGYRWRI